MTTGSSPRRDVERNHAAIVSAAMAVLAREPDATLAEIARVSGLGRSTLYRHFPDRETLVQAIVDRLLDESDTIIADSIAAAGDAHEIDTLVEVADALAALGDRYDFIEMEHARRHARQSSGRGRRVRRLLDLIENGQRSGAIRSDLSAEWLTAMLGHAIAEAAERHTADTDARRAALGPTIRSLMEPPTAGR